MRLEEDLKLDYKDVLIRPKRSTLKSRSEVSLERKTRFRNYEPDFDIDEYHYRGRSLPKAQPKPRAGLLGQAGSAGSGGLFAVQNVLLQHAAIAHGWRSLSNFKPRAASILYNNAQLFLIFFDFFDFFCFLIFVF